MRVSLIAQLWALAAPLTARAIQLPLSTSGRWFIDAKGDKFTYIGVNWPGHMEAMIPEGLQYQPISAIVGKIKSLGMNSIRLTYATQMVDDIFNGNRDITVKDGILKFLGEVNGTELFDRIVAKNPFITPSTTRLQVFDAVVSECAKQDIVIHLDNHISTAKWCCNSGDGNSWFGDKEFNTDSWKRGWKYMVQYTLKWPNLVSFGLRNELRSPDSNPGIQPSYNWTTWQTHMHNMTLEIHEINPKAIVFLSGLGFDTDLSPVATGRDLGGKMQFRASEWPKNKTALELHRYDSKPSNSSCSSLKESLSNSGWKAMEENNTDVVNHFPVIMTEFGFLQDSKTYKTVYAQCLKEFFGTSQAGWMYWVLAGSYYRRQGKVDSDELWGILNHDWSDWRNSEVVKEYFLPMAQAAQQGRV